VTAQRGRRYDAVAFDLLTALIDSWALWNEVAGTAEAGLRWRKRYLEITYGCGPYRPYEDLVMEAASATGIPRDRAGRLHSRWGELRPWPEAPAVLAALESGVPIGVATNCSEAKGRAATGGRFAAVVTAETVGFYKPDRRVDDAVLAALGTDPSRTLFVAGSASDVAGAKAAGMRVFWHNRIALPCPDGAAPDFVEHYLESLAALVTGAR
jgi:2-haloalkanoic acid dehalogenase type II